MASACALAIISGKNILFVVPKRLRAFRNYFFTGGGFPLYDRIMNLSKHFCKALDSTGKLAIMVLALRNKEC
jgi:hypothetical protein